MSILTNLNKCHWSGTKWRDHLLHFGSLHRTQCTCSKLWMEGYLGIQEKHIHNLGYGQNSYREWCHWWVHRVWDYGNGAWFLDPCYTHPLHRRPYSGIVSSQGHLTYNGKKFWHIPNSLIQNALVCADSNWKRSEVHVTPFSLAFHKSSNLIELSRISTFGMWW